MRDQLGLSSLKMRDTLPVSSLSVNEADMIGRLLLSAHEYLKS